MNRLRLTLDTYQAWVEGNGNHNATTNLTRGMQALTYSERDELTAGLGIAGEAGECADLVKKNLLHGAPRNAEKMLLELGDVLWYLAMLAARYGFTLQDVADANVEKLCKRYPPDGRFSTAASVARADEAGAPDEMPPRQEPKASLAKCFAVRSDPDWRSR